MKMWCEVLDGLHLEVPSRGKCPTVNSLREREKAILPRFRQDVYHARLLNAVFPSLNDLDPQNTCPLEMWNMHLNVLNIRLKGD